jgi:hypothetical protein
MTRTHWAYFQVRPYKPRYRVAELVIGSHRSEFLGEVNRVSKSKWEARIYTDPDIRGYGRTRDQAIQNAYDQVGGEG